MSFRPLLPIKHANPYVSTTGAANKSISVVTLPLLQVQSGNIPPVKYQILNCQGQDILVGRLKILTNTGSGHAFILRRFDTGAISATTMFRAAFPNANEQEEKTEINWIKERYDLSGNNGSMGNQLVARLAGVWVSPEVALELGTEYSLGALINVIADARPDPHASYRRSGKSGASVNAGAAGSPQQNASQNAYSHSPAASPQPAAKRRRDSSPAPLPTLSQTTQNQVPRRSARTKSPAPRSSVQQFSAVVVPRTPKAFKTAVVVAARREETTVTPGGSEETIVEEHEEVKADAQKVIDHVAGEELLQQDLREQKELIERLKAQKAEEAMRRAAAAEAERVEQGEEAYEEEEQEDEKMNGKRAREEVDAPLQFQIREPHEQESGEREIATNSRVEKWRATKRVAWGVAAFAAGLGAVLLPTFF